MRTGVIPEIYILLVGLALSVIFTLYIGVGFPSTRKISVDGAVPTIYSVHGSVQTISVGGSVQTTMPNMTIIVRALPVGKESNTQLIQKFNAETLGHNMGDKVKLLTLSPRNA